MSLTINYLAGSTISSCTTLVLYAILLFNIY